MTRCPIRGVGTVLNINEVPAHILVRPSRIAGDISDEVPFIVRGPGKVHCVDLRATTKSCSAWVVENDAVIAMLAYTRDGAMKTPMMT
jgi:hypothetical protein